MYYIKIKNGTEFIESDILFNEHHIETENNDDHEN